MATKAWHGKVWRGIFKTADGVKLGLDFSATSEAGARRHATRLASDPYFVANWAKARGTLTVVRVLPTPVESVYVPGFFWTVPGGSNY
jgi:hypothetical protein